MDPNACVVVPWHSEAQFTRWCEKWKTRWRRDDPPYWFLGTQDKGWRSCAQTKNLGLKEAIARRFKYAVVIDDDCYPIDGTSLEEFVALHLESMKPRECQFGIVTTPASRGTPHKRRSAPMPVAASMGFWTGVGDVDAATDIVLGHALTWHGNGVFVHDCYFPLCGMNLCIDLSWWPWCQFIDVPRYDDIWMGWLWQKRAYAVGACFSLDGPSVVHARQSDPWQNLVIEAPNMKANEELWDTIRRAESIDYEELRRLLPC